MQSKKLVHVHSQTEKAPTASSQQLQAKLNHVHSKCLFWGNKQDEKSSLVLDMAPLLQ
jgi:hypothetical protein